MTWPRTAKGRRIHLLARDGEPCCFSRDARGPRALHSADLGAVDCTRCLSIVGMERALADRAWAYHLRVSGCTTPPAAVDARRR